MDGAKLGLMLGAQEMAATPAAKRLGEMLSDAAGQIKGFVVGGPSPMEPDLVQTQMGATLAPGMTRRPNVLPWTYDAETGQTQLAMPKVLDILTSGAGSSTRALTGTASPSSMAAKTVSMYDLPRSSRALEMDYPHGAPVDSSGRITHSIDGVPLVAENVVGLREVPGGQQAFPREKFDALTEVGTGRSPQIVASREIGGAAGAVEVWPGTNQPKNVFLKTGMAEADKTRVHGHENGHVVDMVAGTIPQAGLKDELRALYNHLNNGNRNANGAVATWGKPSTPQSQGYSAGEVPGEMMAEAVRAYMTDPASFKNIAPKTAEAIRRAANENPRLSPFIQFNTTVPAPKLMPDGRGGLVDEQGRPFT